MLDVKFNDLILNDLLLRCALCQRLEIMFYDEFDKRMTLYDDRLMRLVSVSESLYNKISNTKVLGIEINGNCLVIEIDYKTMTTA